MTRIASETPTGDELRFAFGANWARFLKTLDDERIEQAERSVIDYLGRPRLDGLSILDLGCGSGLFSLAFTRLGAARVVSIDYDTESVGCAQELRDRFGSGETDWTIRQGDALDAEMIAELGTFDIVYSWGVLHHTGEMWTAIDHATRAVAPGGTLFISIYNDQGLRSRMWTKVKEGYGHCPESVRPAYVAAVMAPREALSFAAWTAKRQPLGYVDTWVGYKKRRGMSRWHDLVDWVGGYPFEVAKPEEVFSFCRERGFVLQRLSTCQGGLGCNQFVLTNDAD